MGWLFGWSDRKTLGEHLVSGNGMKTLKHCWKGNNLWTVHEYTYDQGEKAGRTVQFVGLYLCQGPAYGNKNDRFGWGYKDMDESAGPNYYNCPLSYIEMVEAHEKANGYGPTGYAAEWRQQVRDQLTKSKRVLVKGQHIKLYGNEYEVMGKFASGHYCVADASREYRLKKSQVKDVEVLTCT